MNKSNILLIIIDSLHFDKSFGPEKYSIIPTIDTLINLQLFW